MAKYQQYDEYKDSGVEWLGEIPNHWEVNRHKYVASFLKGRNPTELSDDYVEGYFPYLSMDSLRGKSHSKFAPLVRGLFLAREGQPLIIWDGSNAGEFVLGKEGIVSSTMAAAFLNMQLDPQYYWYLCLCFEPEMRRHANGMGIPHVNGDELKNINLGVPAKLEQTQIASFLDHETSKIDTLIEKQQTLIQLLKEKRQAVISHAVTKGLNPDALMKDSGVEWLGEVPEHWEVSKLKYYSSIQGGYAFSSDSFTEEGVQILKIGNVYQNRLALERQPTFVPEVMLEALPDFIVKDGDILMSLTGTLGKRDYGFAVAIKDDGKYLLNQRVAKLNPADEKIDRDFLLNVLWSESYLNQLYSLPSGTKQANLSNSDVLDIVITLPPSKTEQKEIAVELQNQKDIFDKAIQKAMTSIELMQERRTALISAAVTGKIDVRGWQVPDNKAS